MFLRGVVHDRLVAVLRARGTFRMTKYLRMEIWKRGCAQAARYKDFLLQFRDVADHLVEQLVGDAFDLGARLFGLFALGVLLVELDGLIGFVGPMRGDGHTL